MKNVNLIHKILFKICILHSKSDHFGIPSEKRNENNISLGLTYTLIHLYSWGILS